MKAKILCLIAILALSVALIPLSGGCAASAEACTVGCYAAAPPLGTVECNGGDTWVSCIAYDFEGKIVSQDQQTCGPVYGGGGGGRDVDPMWCSMYWFICNPFQT